MMNFEIPAFYINLNHSVYRKNRFLKESAPTYFKNLARFEGVVGKNLSIKDINLTDNAKNSIINKYRKTGDDMGTMGALGCTMSHLGLWKKIVDDNLNYALIFEDDSDIANSNCESIGKLNLSEIDFDVLLLHRNQAIEDDGQKFAKVKKFFGTYAYMITKKGAQKLLDHAFPINEQIDAYMSQSISRHGMKILNAREIQISHHLSFGFSEVGHWEIYQNYIFATIIIIIILYFYYR